MPSDFTLVVQADDVAGRADLCLMDAAGVPVASRPWDIARTPVATADGLFNLGEWLRACATSGAGGPGGDARRVVSQIGVSLAREVLGPEIFAALSRSEASRTLRVCLPGGTSKLGAALARVPWEIARAGDDQPTLAESRLEVRVVVGGEPPGQPLGLAEDEALRVLLVFADAAGSRPLAARQERRQLVALFEGEICPGRRVEVDVLAHGVTRERLRSLIHDRRGYHVVHWSGDGHGQQLELAGREGQPDRVSGEELAQLLGAGGGLPPRLVFLGGCRSSDARGVDDWAAFQDVVEGCAPAVRDEGGATFAERPGHTGTAEALLRAGVASVVAMRYAVGDEYARDLTVDFYRALWAGAETADVAEALKQARRQRRAAALEDPVAGYAASDHAAAVLYGLGDPGLGVLHSGAGGVRSRRRRGRGIPIRGLDIDAHPYFVGRSRELAVLGARFMGVVGSRDEQPVAVVEGMSGMGKTALLAEALDLWQGWFDHVLLFQAKPGPLSLDNTLREIHRLLWEERGKYHAHVASQPEDAVWRATEGQGEEAFRGARRVARLQHNLLRAMRDEALLLVLDNFEMNLKAAAAGPSSEEPGRCEDAGWDELLELLASELRGTASRVLIASQRRLSVLSPERSLELQLGPLSSREAGLYVRAHPPLRELLFSREAEERDLACRGFSASRFHPLLLDRLSRLVAGGAASRARLEEGLRTLESLSGYAELPELFAARAARTAEARELEYLREALQVSVDFLLEHAGAEARRLLWIVALANEPVTLGLLCEVWRAGGEAHARPLPGPVTNLGQLPAELRAHLETLPPEVRETLVASRAPVCELEPLLGGLTGAGLLSAERPGPHDANPGYTCHELVRERILAWMAARPEERAGREEHAVRLTYAGELTEVFRGLLHTDAPTALEAVRRALVYCVQAEAYDQLGSFAGLFLTGTDAQLLDAVLPHLETAAHSVPTGRAHWRCLAHLADALDIAGRPDASVAFYEQATAEAQAAEDWADVAWITGHWATGLHDAGHFAHSHAKRLESVDAHRRANGPRLDVVVAELEAYRIDVMGERVAQVVPEVEERLAQVETWWRRARETGARVPDAPDGEVLVKALVSALEIARQAHFACQDWPAALPRVDRLLELKCELGRPEREIAADRVNRAVVLMRLGRYGEAQAELEACVKAFAGDPMKSSKLFASLADLFDKRGDVQRAVEAQRRALAMCEQIPAPAPRATAHHNLAHYFEKTGTPSGRDASMYHRLADLAYCVSAGLGVDLQISLRNCAVRWRGQAATEKPLTVPRLADLLGRPDFRHLAQWLDQRKVDRAALQAALDQHLESALQATEL